MSNTNFEPKYKLLKKYPGMDEPVGTIFGKVPGFISLRTQPNNSGCSSWTIDYFEPYVGEFFEPLQD